MGQGPQLCSQEPQILPSFSNDLAGNITLPDTHEIVHILEYFSFWF